MSDRHRPLPRRVNSLTAAARILQPVRQDAPRPQHWHDEAWQMRDVVGELRFAETWLSNAFSRSRLFAARRPEPGKEPEPVDSGPAYDLVARLAGGVGGQSSLLRSFGSFLLVPGVGYLVGEPKGRTDKFIVVDSEDLRLGSATNESNGERVYELREEDGVSGWRPLSSGTVVTKVYRQHPRRRWEPDSPTRAALPILRELVLLTQHVEASAQSRLAGAGVQAFPTEMEFPDGWEEFVKSWIDAMMKPAKDRSLPAALVPFPIRIPGDQIRNWKEGFMSYATAFDDKSIELREEAITRLGNAMDMPRQVLTGEQRNHWGDWQVEESGMKLHVEPGLETICDGLTVGFLTPGLDAAADASQAAARDLEKADHDTPDGEWLIWYDTSDLRVRPDRGTAATDSYDRWEADGEALRKELGISDAGVPMPDDPETQRRIWFHVLSNFESMAPLALEKLGLLKPEEYQTQGGSSRTYVTGDEPGVPSVEEVAQEKEQNKRSLPRREEPPKVVRTPPEQKAAAMGGMYLEGADAPPLPAPGVGDTATPVEVPDVPPTVTPGIAIVAALDGIVHRAMERAGRRVLNKMRRGPTNEECPAVRLHTKVKLDSYLPIDTLFEDAWERVPEVAARLDEDADALTVTLDHYVRMLVLTRTEHDWDGLARALGVCPCEGASDGAPRT